EFAYIEAARALGVGHSRIAFRHVLPNTVGPFIVLMTAQFGGAILVEAALSFLGLGIPEPYPSWGRMLSVSAAEFAQKAPWLVLFPGIAISLVVFASNLLGDAVRDKLDARLGGAERAKTLALQKARINQAKSSKSLSDARRSRLGTPRSKGQGPGAPASPGSRRAQRLLSLTCLRVRAA